MSTENQQPTAKSYILNQSNLDNVIKYLRGQPWDFSNPIIKFFETSLIPIEESAALELIESEKPKNESNS